MKNMKRFTNWLFLEKSAGVSFLAIALAAVLTAAGTAQAATISKTDNTDNLNLTTSWVGGVVPSTNDIAWWTNTVTAANSTVLGANQSWYGIRISNPGGLVTIGGANTLTLGTNGINMTLATQNLTLNCGLTLRNTGK